MVKLRESNEFKSVEISPFYRRIDEDLIDKWQGVLDIASKMYKVPSALIMRLHPKDIEVLVKSNSRGNPYESGEMCELGLGLYCETVIGHNRPLHVANALDDKVWIDNPDVKLQMISYYGLPISWPDGSVFGTICILDSKTRYYDDRQKKLLGAFRDTIEKDLELLHKQIQLEKNMEEIKRSQGMILDFEKNKLTNQLVSSISHEISTPIGVALTTASYMDYVLKKSPGSYDKLKEGASLVQKNLDQASKMLKTFKQITDDKDVEKESLVHLETFIKSVIMSMKYDLQEHKVSVEFDIDDKLQVKIYTYALIQVLLNLTVNATLHAFKEDREKKIVIRAKTEKDGIILSFSDNGVGMTEETCDKAFEPFVRYDMETEGSGLGLTIVKDLVERVLKGTIDCGSGEEGTIFTMYLPVEVTYETH
ncbi:GAF domain-containing sensor histidine kinase [Acidaminobacter sp. JC074]|uniref:GAF domain-containing sensor histidine kinase n=1 Tax=Acidaminobacter sp. JC074 TaxID=2530199 RepID=UPI001F10BDC6|nr:GAF domain-containing sensor histidine kinase [Acidaminobacter sp. JC074]